MGIAIAAGGGLAYALRVQLMSNVQPIALPCASPWCRIQSISLWKMAALAGLIGVLYFSILLHLIAQWRSDPNFSHGFLVPLFSAFVLWQKRGRLAGIPLSPTWWGLPILLFAIVLLVVGSLGSELFLARTSLLFLIASLVVLFAGWDYFRWGLFPWAFLFLMIPIPTILFNQITVPLQALASAIAAFLLPLAGVPVLREGNIIHLPKMSLEVAEACSGVRSLLSLVSLAIIYGYFRESRNALRFVIMFASVPIAILSNSFRILGTGVLVQYGTPDMAESFFHSLSGVFIFLFCVLMLTGFHRLLRGRTRDRGAIS